MSLQRLWAHSGNLPNRWFQQYLTIPDQRGYSEVRFVFIVKRGYSMYTAVGIDEIELKDGRCESSCK